MLKKLGIGVLVLAGPTVLLILYVSLRHLVYWSANEEVLFSGNDLQLAGTFVKPNEDGV